jgi:hypothetical protein
MSSSNIIIIREPAGVTVVAAVGYSVLYVFTCIIFVPVWFFYTGALWREALRRWPVLTRDGCIVGIVVPVAACLVGVLWPLLLAWDVFVAHYNDDLELGFSCCGINRRTLGFACRPILGIEEYHPGIVAKTDATDEPLATPTLAVRWKGREAYHSLPTEDLEEGLSRDQSPAGQ